MELYASSNTEIRFSDCDPFGHLNNARYIDYFLNAREDHLLNHFDLDLSAYYKKGTGWVVSRHEIIYARPALVAETVTIKSGLISAGADHFAVEFIMTDEKASHLKSLMISHFTPVSLQTGKRITHPDDFMSIANAFLVPAITQIDAASRMQAWKALNKTAASPVA